MNLTRNDVASIMEMRTDGKCWREIGYLFDVGENTVKGAYFRFLRNYENQPS